MPTEVKEVFISPKSARGMVLSDEILASEYEVEEGPHNTMQVQVDWASNISFTDEGVKIGDTIRFVIDETLSS